MPSTSKAQARFVRAKAAEGVPWAKRWAKHEGSTKKLPERKSDEDYAARLNKLIRKA